MAVRRARRPSRTGVRGRYAGPVPALDVFRPRTREWFERTFDGPTPRRSSAGRRSPPARTLIQAPTGSGKTLAAFLYGLDRLLEEPGEGTRLVYVSPLKALNYDIERNLRGPLAGLQADVNVAVRTGDTPQKERAAMLRRPPDLLITTPESLFLMLTSRARDLDRRPDADPRRGARRRRHQARRPPRALRRAPRAPDRRAVPADRALGDAASDGGDRQVRLRRAADRARRRRPLEGARRGGRRPARGHARAGRERGDHRPARHRR